LYLIAGQSSVLDIRKQRKAIEIEDVDLLGILPALLLILFSFVRAGISEGNAGLVQEEGCIAAGFRGQLIIKEIT